jgi:tRNA(Ile2) C34 agmatinyltransferase TiaS
MLVYAKCDCPNCGSGMIHETDNGYHCRMCDIDFSKEEIDNQIAKESIDSSQDEN